MLFPSDFDGSAYYLGVRSLMSYELVARYAEIVAIVALSFWLGSDRSVEPAASLAIAITAYLVTEYRFINTVTAKRETDRATLRDFVAALPPAVLEFFRDHDFGQHFRLDALRALRDFRYEWHPPDRMFHDQDLQALLQKLLEAAEAFDQTLTAKTFSQGSGFYGVEKTWRDTVREKELDQAIADLNHQAAQVVEARNRLVEQARRRLGS